MTPNTSCVTNRRSCGERLAAASASSISSAAKASRDARAVQHIGRDLPGGRHDSTSGPNRMPSTMG